MATKVEGKSARALWKLLRDDAFASLRDDFTARVAECSLSMSQGKLVRELQQPQHTGATYRSERVNVRMSQSLHLPLDLKVLLGFELARSENSRILLDALDADGSTRRYIGGLAVNF